MPSQPTKGQFGATDHSEEKCENEGDSFFTEDMLEEEKKIELENVAEEAALRKELEEREKEEQELKEKRYKRLMHLLTKSEFYSQFLLKQIETQDLQNKQKRGKARSTKSVVNKENSSSEANSSQDSTTESNKRGTKRKGAPVAGKRTKLLRDGNYKIGDVIDSNTVKANAGMQTSEKEDVEQIEQPRLFENGTMRPYQLDGFSWLMVLYENGVNGILGDEMGLGKTIQCIALLCHLVDKGVPGPFLIIGPLSTLPNWKSEFQRFAPKISTVLYHGPAETRLQRRHEMNKLVPVESSPHLIYPVVITSYEVAIRDTKLLNRYQWRYICVDEGHRLKNHQCRLTKSLNTFSSSNRLLMTGTPLQNNLAELWALLNFLMPEIFDSLDVFESWFDVSDMMQEGSSEKIVRQEKEKQVIHTLMKILSPFFLRRVKKDVDLGLPPKRELLVYTPMTAMQVDMYEATLKSNMNFFKKMKEISTNEQPIEYDMHGRPKRNSRKSVDYTIFNSESVSDAAIQQLADMSKDTSSETKPGKKTSILDVKLQSRMQQCRRVVNHPYLVNYPLTDDGHYKVDENLLKTCGKLQVLDQLLNELHKNRHRVLLFSQSTRLLDILEDYLTLRPKYSYKRLDGSTNIDNRQIDIKEFNEDDSHFLFLLSTRAGGLGINLASADTVIIYDSDWNPQCDLQAQDRCHRIGQTRPVLILRLITSNTIDEQIVHRASTKRKLEKLIIQSGKFNSAKQSDRKLEALVNTDELLKLLSERDHNRVHRTETGNVFSKQELRQLLDRSDLLDSSSKAKELKDHLKGVFQCVDSEEISV